MTTAALTKLLILVIFAFIICLPEFFAPNRGQRVNLLCTPHRASEGCGQSKTEEAGETEVTMAVCDPQLPSGSAEQQPLCPGCDHHNGSGCSSCSAVGWFLCDADKDVAHLSSNSSWSGRKVPLDLSLKVKLAGAESINLTVHGSYNGSLLQLHLPEEAGKEEIKGEEEQGEIYCVLPHTLTSSSTINNSCCFLRLTNQTLLDVAQNKTLLWILTDTNDEWCMFKALWVFLLGVVLLIVLTTVVKQIYWGRSCYCKKPRGLLVSSQQTSRSLGYKVGVMRAVTDTPKGQVHHNFGSRHWSQLPTIDEVETSVHLQHRGHSVTSPLTTEEEAS